MAIPKGRTPSFREALFLGYTVRRAFKVCLIVGTILTLLNQWDRILKGDFPPLWMVLLTYVVPYCVSSYSTSVLLSDKNIMDIYR